MFLGEEELTALLELIQEEKYQPVECNSNETSGAVESPEISIPVEFCSSKSRRRKYFFI
jgi:hypothetical protein